MQTSRPASIQLVAPTMDPIATSTNKAGRRMQTGPSSSRCCAPFYWPATPRWRRKVVHHRSFERPKRFLAGFSWVPDGRNWNRPDDWKLPDYFVPSNLLAFLIGQVFQVPEQKIPHQRHAESDCDAPNKEHNNPQRFEQFAHIFDDIRWHSAWFELKTEFDHWTNMQYAFWLLFGTYL